MNIRKGDNVIMLAGKDRGKTGKVLSVLEGRVVIEGLNTIKKHQRAKKQGQKGQIITKERAVDRSNVQIVCPKCGKPTRIGHQVVGDRKIRICKKCQAEF
ncbi:MAG: 50S ribosomal protein L24 [Patescibacteria group bacterium]